MSSLNWASNLCKTREEREAFCQFKDENDGIHQHVDGTYWWYDEIQANEFGGFITFEEAKASLTEYHNMLYLNDGGTSLTEAP